MDWSAIINFLLIAGAIQGFIFNIVTFLVRKKFGVVIVFLNLTVLFISLNNLQAWLIDNGYSSGLFYIKHMLIPWHMLIIPVFYSFLVNYLDVQNKIRTYIRLTIALFTFELLLRSAIILYVQHYLNEDEVTIIAKYTAIEEIVNALFSLFIFLKALQLVFKKEEYYFEILHYDDIKWIKLFLGIGGTVFLLWIVAIIGINTTGNSAVRLPMRLAISILLYWIGYQGLFRYTIVQDRILLRKSLIATQYKDISVKRKISDDSDFRNEKHDKAFRSIEKVLINEKKFLDPLMSMERLAEEVTMSTSHLSKLINNYSGQNFSDYINELRINQAKILLTDKDFSKYTIISIGLECGFNSKSTFYTAFKKFTKQTPSHYRDQYS